MTEQDLAVYGRNEMKKLFRKIAMMNCEIAKQLGVCERSVSRWRNGEDLPSLANYWRLCELSKRNAGGSDDSPADHARFVWKWCAKALLCFIREAPFK